MKISLIEISGFRGFRDRTSISIPDGFVVINGRNGVGKSTVCDAIEFALTGSINKYSVEKAARETLSDYIWWRGGGVTSQHYVRIGIKNESGVEQIIERTREGGCNLTNEALADLLCDSTLRPTNAIEQICKSTLIRDEWISQLSLDLNETERFDFVRSAIGAFNGHSQASRSSAIVKAAQELVDEGERTLNQIREELDLAIVALSSARAEVKSSEEVSNALQILTDHLKAPDFEITTITSIAQSAIADSWIVRSKLRRAIEIISQIEDLRSELSSDTLEHELVTLEAEQGASFVELEELQSRLAAATSKIEALKEASGEMYSLAALVEHGSLLGLRNHAQCPLCNSVVDQKSFARSIQFSKSRLNQMGERILESEKAASELRTAVERARGRADSLKQKIRHYKERFESLFFLEKKLSETLGIDQESSRKVKRQELLEQLNSESEFSLLLEGALSVLMSSQSADRIVELESRVSEITARASQASIEVSRRRKATALAKELDYAVKRANAEVMDERLAAISPLLADLYLRLRPHAQWKKIEYRIRGDVKRMLSLTVGEKLNPQFMFSSGQRRAAGLAFLLSVHLSRPWCKLNSLLLDDPVQHIDDYRALNLVEVLGSIRQSGRQVICAVEDAALADLMCRRFRGSEESPGIRVELSMNRSTGAYVSEQRVIRPMKREAFSFGDQLGDLMGERKNRL